MHIYTHLLQPLTTLLLQMRTVKMKSKDVNSPSHTAIEHLDLCLCSTDHSDLESPMGFTLQSVLLFPPLSQMQGQLQKSQTLVAKILFHVAFNYFWRHLF